MKICFLTKIDKYGSTIALDYIKKVSKKIDVFCGDLTDPLPTKIKNKNYDLIISYLSPWIVPKSVLNNTKKWNINFHPGSPEYPGIGCFNFAIYDSAKEFGATAHLMDPKVDTGKIISVERFSISDNETVETLSKETYKSLLLLYKNVIDYIVANNSLPNSDETWTKKPYTRKKLEDLATINNNMSKKEIEKRIRATYYRGKPCPFIDIFGYKFEFNPDR